MIVGTHAAGPVEKMLLGSGAEEIFRKAKVPVLTIGPVAPKEPWFEIEFKNILFATDFGKGAEREATYAFSLAQEHRSRLTLLHVFPHPEAYGKETLIEMEHNFYTQLRELVPADAEMRCKVEVRVVFGDPAGQILRIAKDTNAELIVMGAKAREQSGRQCAAHKSLSRGMRSALPGTDHQVLNDQRISSVKRQGNPQGPAFEV